MSTTSPPLACSRSQRGKDASSTPPGLVDSVQKRIRTTEAAKHLQIDAATLRKWVRQGLIPATRVGPKLLMFDPNEVDKLAQRIDNRTASA